MQRFKMALLAALNHVTEYTYDHPISFGMQTIRLRPAPHTRSHIQSYSLNIEPKEHFINWQQDPFGNYLAKVVIPEKATRFRIEVDLVTEIRVFNPFDFFLEDYAKEATFAYEALLKEELAPYLELKESDPQLMALVNSVPDRKQNIIDWLVKVNQSLNQQLKYIVRMEPGIQSCSETLSNDSGSCRDMAWLLCQLLRHLGFASRFASGYLIQLKPDVKALDGPSGTEVDFTDLHAWTEIYLPGAGWVGMDPTSGLFTGEGHIPLCCTPNPSSAAPVSGTHEKADSKLKHSMTVTRIYEAARVTKPFSDSQWQQVDLLGAKIDADLLDHDVRLTMGGEPTFVSAEDREGEEWNYTALSEEKAELGNELFLKLREKFAAHSFVQYTQGKWYPGEILPRWAMNCYWRKDGQKFWDQDTLLADPMKEYGHESDIAAKFAHGLAKALGIEQDFVQSAYEDTPYHLWKEQRLPTEGEMFKADLLETAERKRLQKLMDQDINKPAGYVLPLFYSPTMERWVSDVWKFRGDHLVLIPGDSPLGLRLPLGSLPMVALPPEEILEPRSPFDMEDELPLHSEILVKLGGRTVAQPVKTPLKPGIIKSALSTEVRNGTLHVFLPPLVYIEHFLELVAAVETVAAQLKTHLIVEGYTPPADVRVQSFSVTPDPGVLEVNVQPAADWDELKYITYTVYEQAFLTRLSADKFMIDGRRVGTGGGNHIVMGAQTPSDSPFLRRPDLLRSMVAFWQNHPALSYLFSSMYIGPTSQSPRIDEARHDSLYELEIAFEQIPLKGEVAPWLVDRLMRNLLVDLTGNTHRAEFCIDKLYSPDSNRGRLGLLEMRAFEMNPHPQMNLLQALLIRACIAHFWQHPFKGKLIRFGTHLHDEYMLPYYIWRDLGEVLAVLQTSGYEFQREWFEPFFAFRFPEYGSVTLGAVTMTLRMGLEPWPVMGEEMSTSGVSRSVDSSVERVQVMVTGLDPARHIVTCNGYHVPLSTTDTSGVYVGGVRYKAWAPPSSLHPTIEAHTPLVFDLVDTVYERSLGGCKYHVAHPGGRSHDNIPVNDNEAEGRRLARFEAMNHTPGKIVVPPLVINPEFPHTLDLRRMEKA